MSTGARLRTSTVGAAALERELAGHARPAKASAGGAWGDAAPGARRVPELDQHVRDPHVRVTGSRAGLCAAQAERQGTAHQVLQAGRRERPKRQRKGHAGQEAAQGHEGPVTQAWTA